MPTDRLNLGLLGLAIVAVVSSAFTDRFTANLLMWVAMHALLAASLRFVMLVGEFNMAVVAFYAVGAYVSGFATTVWGAPLLVSLLGGAVAAAIVSIAFGFVTMRVKGPYFMLISFAFAEVLRLVLSRWDAVGGNNGIVGIFPPRWLEAYFPALTIAVVTLLLVAMYAIERSHYGKVFSAIRSNDAIPRSAGIDVLAVKVACLGVASFAAGLGGAFYAHANNVISPGDFTFLVAAFALAYVKLGGESDPAGPVLGAILLTLVAQYLMRYGHLEHLFYGTAILLGMLVLPDGVLGLLRRLPPFAAPARAGVRAAQPSSSTRPGTREVG
jgi:branched-chain amino acid transport system permease protein